MRIVGQVLLALTFFTPVARAQATQPVLWGFSPMEVFAGSPPFDLAVSGTDFVSGAVVKLGSTLLDTTFQNANGLVAHVPSSALSLCGALQVQVINPGGAATPAPNYSQLSVRPSLASVSPNSLPVGVNTTITLTGAGFVPYVVVLFNVVDGASNWIDQITVTPTTITALIPGAMVPKNGSATVQVLDPRGDFHDPRGAGGWESTKLSVQIGTGVNLNPVLQNQSPGFAIATGKGFTLTVDGANFAQGAVVQWNSSALATQFVSSSRLIATVPPSLNQTAGLSSILVRNPDGGTSLPVSYTTLPGSPLQIDTLTPNIVDKDRPELTLTIDGSGFTSRDTLTISGVPKPFVVVSENRITSVIPSGFFGDAHKIDVILTNEVGNHSNTAQLWVTMQPILSSVSPQSATAGGPDLTLAVTGGTFLPGAYITFGGKPLVTDFGAAAGGIRATLPASLTAAPGTFPVSVVNMGNRISTSLNFTVLPPALSLSSVAPSSAIAGGPALTLTLNGAGFQSGATVFWKPAASQSAAALATAFVTSAQHTAVVPASLLGAAGTAAVYAVNPGGAQTSALTFTITSNPPSLASLTPNSSVAGSQQLSISINGSNFTTGAVAQVAGGPLATTYVSTSRLTALIPASLLASAGTLGIQILNPGGSVSNEVAFTVTPAPPAVSSLSPAAVNAGSAAFTLTVTGSGFASDCSIQWNGVPFPTARLSATQLSAPVPPSFVASAGNATITVVNPGAAISNSVVLPILSAGPNLFSLSPSSIAAGNPTFAVTLNGSNFVPSSTAITQAGQSLATQFVNSTSLTVTIPASLIAAPGSLSIYVRNPDALISGVVSLTVEPAPPPVLTQVSPNSTIAGGSGLTLTITGTGFASTPTALWNGTALVTQFSSAYPTYLSATVPATLLTVAGVAAVAVRNPGGAPSNPLTFIVTEGAAQLTSLQPSTAVAGDGAFTLTVNGSGFNSGSIVQWGQTPLPTTFVHSTQLTAQVAAALVANAGSASVTVLVPVQGASTSLRFTITPLAPSLLSVSPSSALAGGPSFTLTVTGNGYNNTAAVVWNGSPLSTTFVSPAQLTAAVPAALIANSGPATVAVLLSGALSESIVFKVVASLPAVTPAGIVNAASSSRFIAPGSLISIYGSNLAKVDTNANVMPLPVSLNGTSVSINGRPAPLLFVSGSQINAMVPFETLPGAARMVVAVNGPESSPTTFDVIPAAPGIFTVHGESHALAVNITDGTLNSPGHPAQPGEYVTIYLTGQGFVDIPVATGAAAGTSPLSRPLATVAVTVGGQPAEVQFAGLAPGFVGILQINLKVPGVSPGEQPLTVSIGSIAAVPAALSISPR